MRSAFLLLFSPVFALAQNTDIRQSTGSTCSPAVADVKGNVMITCSGIDALQKKLLERVPALLDQLLKRQQGDRDQIVAKLEELLKGQVMVAQELVALRDKATPRALSPAAAQALSSAVSKYPGQVFRLASEMGDQEAYALAQRIQITLEGAGWKVSEAALGRIMSSGQPQSGVKVSAAAETAAALAILKALVDAGIRTQGELDPNIPRDSVGIQVWRKPD